MALSITNQANPLAARLTQQTVANATADANVLGGAGTLYMIDVDNTANVTAVYVKIFDAAAPTVGTTAPDIILRVPSGLRRVMAITEGQAFTNISFCCVTAAATTSVASPASAVIVRLLTS